MRLPALLSTTLALAAFAPAQTASFTTYGTGCGAPGNPPPLIQALTLPQIGAAFTVRFVALPSGQTPVSVDWPAMIMGLQQAQTPVPVLSPSQPANCNFLLSTDVILFMPWNGTSYQNTFTMQIPNDPGLIGVSFHQQWAELYSRCQPTCQPLMIRVTNAATATVGL
ncbi:MAG: hypothetical protein H6838_00770 [Planctomycetes bacterium]|nr:hypothetical protein [Planctomycetota bacterium]MCB9883987.1 hypothetical protein [Planctomycetota bacterium]